MAQTFEWPNLVAASRLKLVLNTDVGSFEPALMHDDVVGEFARFTPTAQAKSWAYVATWRTDAMKALAEGDEVCLCVAARYNGAPWDASATVKNGNGLDTAVSLGTPTFTHVGGGGRSRPCRRRATRSRGGASAYTSRSAPYSSDPAPRSTSRSRWCAAAASPTPGRRRKVRCGHER